MNRLINSTKFGSYTAGQEVVGFNEIRKFITVLTKAYISTLY